MLLVAFLAFTGVAAMVPGGLVQATREGGTTPPLSETYLIVLAAGDALIAFLLGYRAAALRVSSLRDALFSALTYGIAIAIAAAAVRALAMPAPARTGPADARVLSLGCVPRRLAGPSPRHRLGLADGPARRPRHPRRRLEPAPARLIGPDPPAPVEAIRPVV